MKKLKEYKFIFIAVSGILLLTVIFAATQYTSPQDKAVGDWELSGTFENFEMRYWDWGEYEYFNLSLSESGAATIFSYPTFSTANSTATEMAIYYLTEEKNGQYDYLIKLFMTNDSELDYYTTRLLYDSKRDELMFFTSLDDGLILKRTEKLTTVEITTTEADIRSYIGRYGTGEYNQYEDFYEGEVNIIDITDTTVVFDIEHYRLWGEENVAAVKNKNGYYYFELSNNLICGYILLEDDNVIIDIVKTDGFIVDFGKTTYHKVQSKPQEETIQNSEEEISDYKSNCAKYINSKDLVRYEQEHLNRNVCFVGKVFGIEDHGNTYVIRTDENHDGIYGDNWMYIKDCRKNDNTKILESDVIVVYGTFTGVRDNYPCIELYFADIRGL